MTLNITFGVVTDEPVEFGNNQLKFNTPEKLLIIIEDL